MSIEVAEAQEFSDVFDIFWGLPIGYSSNFDWVHCYGAVFQYNSQEFDLSGFEDTFAGFQV